jgi:hypothetical protein
MDGPLVQRVAASWDSLCPDLKEQIFAPLSLPDLGRAAPISRDFRAAYKARLSTAHPAAVDAGISLFGEKFLRDLSTQIIIHARRVHLMYRGGGDVRWCLSHCSPYDGYSNPRCSYPGRSLFCWADYFGLPKCTHPESPQIVCPHNCPSFSVRCVKQGCALHIKVSCFSAQCREAAAAVAAVCGYLHGEVGSSTPRRCRKPLKPALFFNVYERDPARVGARPSEGEVSGVVTALLPLSSMVDIRRISWALLNRPEHVRVREVTDFLAIRE